MVLVCCQAHWAFCYAVNQISPWKLSPLSCSQSCELGTGKQGRIKWEGGSWKNREPYDSVCLVGCMRERWSREMRRTETCWSPSRLKQIDHNKHCMRIHLSHLLCSTCSLFFFSVLSRVCLVERILLDTHAVPGNKSARTGGDTHTHGALQANTRRY